jgi:hypothetical protein
MMKKHAVEPIVDTVLVDHREVDQRRRHRQQSEDHPDGVLTVGRARPRPGERHEDHPDYS